MREVIMIKTFDGRTHRTKDEAYKHLENRYAQKVKPLISGLVSKNSFEMGGFIRENLIHFSALRAITQDMEYYALGDE